MCISPCSALSFPVETSRLQSLELVHVTSASGKLLLQQICVHLETESFCFVSVLLKIVYHNHYGVCLIHFLPKITTLKIIFSSSRYGIYERCRELVEAGYDVRQPDKENVTLLHWAAINNRIDLVKYVLYIKIYIN